jgi:thymidylate kinase
MTRPQGGMVKRIIVEGPDGSGKSTLVETLEGYLGSNRVMVVPGFYHQSQYKDYSEWLSHMVTLGDGYRVPIFDRLLYSELVYQPIFRPGAPGLTPQASMGYRQLLARTSFLIYCHVPYELLVKYAAERPQMEGVNARLYQIYRAYERVMEEEYPEYFKHGHYATYNFTLKLPIHFLLQKLENYLKESD